MSKLVTFAAIIRFNTALWTGHSVGGKKKRTQREATICVKLVHCTEREQIWNWRLVTTTIYMLKPTIQHKSKFMGG